MKVRNIALTASAFLLMVGTFVAVKAQGQLYDRVTVDLPYTVTVRDTTLQPGQYVIQRLVGDNRNRVVQIFGNDGKKFETAILTIATVDNKSPDKTEVVLYRFGSDYYFDKIWIQGKDYGYEFPLPKDVQSRESERGESLTVGAKYENATGEDTATAPQPSAATAESAELHQPVATEQPSTNEPSTTQPTPVDLEPEAQIPDSTEAVTRPYALSQENGRIAQAQPPAVRPSASVAIDDLPPATTEFNDAQIESRNREMPKTASNWLSMLLTGCLLSAAGIALRRAAA